MIQSRLPKSSKETFDLIKEIIDMGEVDIPQKYIGNTGAPGNTLEFLMDVQENNFDSPDYRDWEMKFHGGSSLITLLHKEPEPKGIINEMVDVFGWPNEKGQLSFRHTFGGASPLGFFVENNEGRVYIKNRNNPSFVAFWEHNALLNTWAAKLRRLILLEGDVIEKKTRVIYKRAYAFWDLRLLDICGLIQDGTIRIDFDARTREGIGSGIRNHGTKLRIDIRDIPKLYLNSVIIE
jgi:hypothetical protein